MEREAAPQPAMPHPESTGSTSSTGLVAAILIAAIAALYVGQDIFVPFALAVLLSFMLAPVVRHLRRIRIPHVPAVLLAVGSSLVVIAALSVLVATQILHLAENLPDYQYTMQEKVRSLRKSMAEGGVIERSSAVLKAVTEELSGDAATLATPAPAPGGESSKEPITVKVQPPEPEPLDSLRSVVGPLLEPIGAAGLTIVFTVFILLQHNDMRDRFIRLVGGNMRRTTEALNEAANRVGRYLVMQLVVNATYGIPIGVGLYLIGVPGAFLWGLLATLLRFVPYLGPFIAATFPLILAFAIDPGWNTLLWTLTLILTIELISNNFVEPLLYGSSTGLSPVAIILAAIFWTLLWGPIGLILSTPLTVCLVVIGRYVPQLSFLGVLLSKEPALQPEERLYQRLVAGNIEEAIEIAEEQVGETSLLEFYASVCIPALCLAENDRQLGSTTRDRRRIAAGMMNIVRELRKQDDKDGPEPEDAIADTSEVVPRTGARVLCLAGRWELDAASAAVLAHTLESRGVKARHLPALTLTLETIGHLDLVGVDVLCLAYYDPAPLTYARFVCRRLKQRMPGLKIALALWNLDSSAGSLESFEKSTDADFVASSLTVLADYVQTEVSDLSEQPMVAPAVPENESQRLEALYATGLLQAGASPELDQVARKVADAFDMPVALVSLVNENAQIWKGAAGLDGDIESTRHAPRETSICAHVVASNAPLVVPDTARDPRFAGNPFVLEQKIRFYAGVPLRTASGHVLGTLCMIDHRPRTLSTRDVKLLQLIADELMRGVESRASPSASDNVQ